MNDKESSGDYEKNSSTLTGSVAMGTGVMIGAGILALTGQVAEQAGGLFPLAFLANVLLHGHQRELRRANVRNLTFACPSDPGTDQVRVFSDNRPSLYPTTYGFNFGRWFVYDPSSREGGDGMLYPISFLGFRDCLDGTSHTLLVAEVKAWTPYTRNGGPLSTTMPSTRAEAEAVVASGAEFKDTGHTEWPDGRVHHTGFTAAMAPNSIVQYATGGRTYKETDYNSWQEGRNGTAGNPTYAVITSRSYHAGLVQVALVDGSVRSVTESVELQIWRDVATRAGNEVITQDW